ncbi:type II toxin-antitoxin system RelE/ParE family toxin [Desulfovibrio sp. OttesenSCG-928-G15]|nr:type II toxin-antitoxin system RelE/ParE family toxin [Desulfovibrio sp. OttesenSCG-928-G15]
MYKVTLTPEAIADILEVYDFILPRDGTEQAEAILARLERSAYSLEKLPMRGKLPNELVPFSNSKIRELQDTPWRIFYRVDGKDVFILAVLDGRRAIEELLLERLAR